MKKIGIITYLNIYNYGSFLQALALKNTIEKMGFGVQFIDVRYSKKDKYIQKLTILKKLICHPDSITDFKKMRRMGRDTISQIPQKTKDSFDKCTKEMLPIKVCSYTDLKKAAHTDEYAAFIAGSDQIWSPLGLELRPHKFLEFAPKEKRMTYAPSFGVSEVPSYNKRKITKNLKSINKLSIREESGRAIIKKLTGINAPVVLDPTLLSEESFRKEQIPDVNFEKPYILCYFLSKPSKETVDVINKYAAEKNLGIMLMPYDFTELFGKNTEIYPASPMEFISCVKNAQTVFTDSFHGTAFSIIFRKSFYTFSRYSEKVFEQSSRITDILDKINLRNRFIDKNTVGLFDRNSIKNDLSEIDEEKLAVLRRESFEYLTSALDSIGEINE